LKDVGGLLTPDRTRELLPKLIKATPGVTWEFHPHCSNGLGPVNAIEAVRAGITLIHTAVPPLANGTSQPSVVTLSRNLRALGFRTRLHEEPLAAVTDHFNRVAEREGFPRGTPLEFDQRLYDHQIPGGMISNLRHQLELAGMADRLEQTLEETGRVRAEFGYPIMVTPLSQFVATQAAVNVIVGDRYAEVTDSTIEFALGLHGGDEAIDGMDAEVRARVLDRPRARELAARKPTDPSLRQLRSKYGRDISDEDLILRAIVGDDANDAIKRSGAKAEANSPLLALVEQILADRRHHFIAVEKGGQSLVVRRPAVAQGD
jgi:oxaloacetate decarboxylase alpha subunit